MKKLKVCVHECLHWQRFGIGQYEWHIVNGLAGLNKYEMQGQAFRVDIGGLPFPVKRHVLPYRYFFDNKIISAVCPFSYNALWGDFSSGVNLFLANQIPRLRLRGPVVSVLYDLIPLRMSDYMQREGMAEGRIRKFREDFAHLVRRSDAICTMSEYSKNDMVDMFGCDPSKVHIVPPGVDVAPYENANPILDAEVKTKYALPDCYFLYVGSSREYKNVDNALRAYARLPEQIRRKAPFVLSGTSERLAQIAAECGISQQVRFLGFVPEIEKPSVYRLASVFVFISLFEGFGMPAIEAMAAGTPVLGSTRTSLPEVIGDCGRMVDPFDLDAIAAEMQMLLEDEALRSSLVKRGYMRARQFSWNNSVCQMENVIDGV